jgi:hypothetical protein
MAYAKEYGFSKIGSGTKVQEPEHRQGPTQPQFTDIPVPYDDPAMVRQYLEDVREFLTLQLGLVQSKLQSL